MTPQASFLVLAPIAAEHEATLRQLLQSMNLAPGVVDPHNVLVPFADFPTIHFARFVILDDAAIDDITAYGVPRPDYPLALAFFGDSDGSEEEILAELARKAEPGLRRIFSCCEGFGGGAALLPWMRRHGQAPAAAYVNTIGRTVRQVHEESALHDALVRYLDARGPALGNTPLQEVRRTLVDFVAEERGQGRLVLTPPAPTPLAWQARNIAHLVGVPLLLLLLTPFFVLYLPIFLEQLRRRETSDPEIVPRPDPEQVAAIAAVEDHDVTNPYIVFGALKPGFFRLGLVIFLLWLVDYAARHIYGSGHITRVRTIHFARWVFVDRRRRMFFASNYDGALESYMDDFINKVGWGLNVLFSNGVGYPRTDWLLFGGAGDELRFKDYIRRHQVKVDVWYKAYPGLTAFDLTRNTLIRQGLEQQTMSDEAIRDWLALF